MLKSKWSSRFYLRNNCQIKRSIVEHFIQYNFTRDHVNDSLSFRNELRIAVKLELTAKIKTKSVNVSRWPENSE
jgi:hypothetical protein